MVHIISEQITKTNCKRERVFAWSSVWVKSHCVRQGDGSVLYRDVHRKEEQDEKDNKRFKTTD